MSDWDALTGHVFALLIRVGVGHELEEPLTKVKIVYHCRALGRRAVPGDALPVIPLRDEHAGKRAPTRPAPGGDICIARLFVNAQRGLMSKKRIQFCRPCERSAYCQPQRSPMNWKAFDV